jgi:hypothetical protein
MARGIAVVTGDITLDWNLARSRGPEAQGPAWESEVCSRLHWQHGGAALLADLVEAVAASLRPHADFEVRQPQPLPRRSGAAEDRPLGPEDPRFHHSYASWMAYPFSARAGDREKPAWRVAEFLGLNRCAVKDARWARVAGDTPDAALVVLDDADLGFRSQPELWPVSLTAPDSRPWVLVKMSRPIAQGPLWDLLSTRHAEKLVVILTIDDFRRTEAQVSRELSWERTAQDLAWEILYNRSLPGLSRCAHVVVSFYAAGALLYCSAARAEAPCRLLFDPEVTERMWERGYPGRMVGYTSSLAAGIARQLMLAPDAPDLSQGVSSGLAALRALHREGYGQRGASAANVDLEFPTRVVVEALSGPTPFQEVAIPVRTGDQYWTILGDRHRNDLRQVARQVVLLGPEKVLQAVPLGRFGFLLTVDRQEIESLRSIGSLISEYVDQPRPKRPLSIAVFGPPGSGKSFGITQLALAIRPGEIEPKEFNLSQFASSEELFSALHQVRDIGLSGKIPLVFWDEFDSEHDGPYGWLRSFLAPMQDGRFQHGDLTHPLGKAIFVFAGGTSETLEQFTAQAEKNPQARGAKVPDFVSRLKGYMNVLGPNPRPGAADPYYLLRRAILLRSMLLRDCRHLVRGGELQIDSGVLRALLETRVYRHGARSMESIIAMSRLASKTRFERSSLPTEAQLDLHVDGRDFLALVQQPELGGALLERLARAAHAVYAQAQTTLGRTVPEFDALPENEQEQNRSQVRDIPAKLARAGCYMVPARGGEPPFTFPPDVLELLAQDEHQRWMEQKLNDGWIYGPGEKDETGRRHNCILPWDELPEQQKEKDRAAVSNITAILAHAGYTVVAGRGKRDQAEAARQS